MRKVGRCCVFRQKKGIEIQKVAWPIAGAVQNISVHVVISGTIWPRGIWINRQVGDSSFIDLLILLSYMLKNTGIYNISRRSQETSIK